MTTRTSIQIILTRLAQLAVLVVAFASQVSFAQTGYQDSESFRSDLLTLLEIQKSLQQNLQPQSATSDPTLALIEKAINEANALTDEELQAFQNVSFSFAPAIESLRELNYAVISANEQVVLQKTGTSTAVDNCDGFVEAPGEMVDPPGPCGQINYEPAQQPPGPFQAPEELTDNSYPIYGLPRCERYQSFGLIFFSRAATIANEVIAVVSKRVCNQIYTAGGVGFNVALACIVTDVAYLVQKSIRDNISNCQTARILSEGTTTYVRVGELFVQSRQNTNTIARRTDAGFNDSQDGLSEIKNQVEENSQKIQETISTLNEIMEELAIENARLLGTD